MIEEDRLIARGDREPARCATCEMILAAWRGQEAEASELIEATLQEPQPQAVWAGRHRATYASSVLYNGLGRHDAARDAAWRAFERDQLGYGPCLVPELAEAASRTGDTALLRAALEWLSERTRVTPERLGAGDRSPRPRPAERRRGRRRSLPRVDRPARPHPRRVSSWPAAICSTASGCAASAAASTRASSCAPPTRCSTTMGIEAFAERARARAGGHRRDRPQAQRRDQGRPHGPGGPDRAARPRRAVQPRDRHAGCSSAAAPSSTTCTRSSPSSTSAHATNSTAPSTATPARRRTPAATPPAGLSRIPRARLPSPLTGNSD